MSILVVNDSHEQRLLLAMALRAGGFHDIRQAASASEAFLQLGLDAPEDVEVPPVQLVLMDILLSPIDGAEACAHITRSPRAQGIPVVMVCGLDDERRLQRAFDMGATDYVMRPIREAELLSRVRHIIRINRDIALRNARERELLVVTRQLASANEALQRLSLQDGLTGIGNRRHLDDYLDREWRRAIRSRSPLSVVMADIDNFKSFNDTYGHQAGDEALKLVAGAMAGALRRAGDLVTRCGGEEFAVVLPDTGVEHAETVAETLRRAVESLAIAHRGLPDTPWITISVGVASEFPDRESTAVALLATADAAMYRSKHAGRNRVTAAA
jgi:diguanylate cyclase (GGDEF)-like protein